MCKSLQTSDFYIDGQINLLNYKELKDVVSDVIRIFSNKKTVTEIISRNYFDGLKNGDKTVILAREEENKNTWFSKGSYEDGFSLKNTFKSNIANSR